MNKSGKSVEDLLNTDISNMAGMSFYCDICKKDHSVDIEKIIIEKGAVNKVPTIAAGFKAGKVFLVADNNTYPVCGEKVETF